MILKMFGSNSLSVSVLFDINSEKREVLFTSNTLKVSVLFDMNSEKGSIGSNSLKIFFILIFFLQAM